MALVGQTVAHYRILEYVGGGGMGEVYKAQDTRLERLVALKFLPASVPVSSQEIARLQREAKAISALNHPNIATLYDVGEEAGQGYLVLEYIPGGTLKARLTQLESEDKELSVSEILEYGIQLADGLAHAHERQIIHLDVKSENVMLTAQGTAKITDFGLARLRGAARVTSSGSYVGTLAYMAPEQLRGEEPDHRADLFSLGVVLYEMATFRLPFRGDHEAALMYSIVNEDPRPIISARQGLPTELELVIDKCLQKDRTQRYQSASEIASDLRKIQHGQPVAVSPGARRRIIPWLFAAGAAILTALGIYFFLPGTQVEYPDSKTIAVLPFEDFSEGHQEEYLSEGITDDILTQLYKIGDLKVISHTTMRQYKSTTKSVREIGGELHAGALLEGSVRRTGDRIRIVAQLIDSHTDAHLWAETYDRDLKDVFAVQSEIAERIADALHATLSSTERERIAAPVRSSVEAYNLLLEGSYLFARSGRDNVAKAIDRYSQVVSLDGANARAWAALAIAYAHQADVGALSTSEGYTKARQAAERALSLDDQLAQAHTIMGWIKRSYDWDWAGAEEECRKALALSPGDVTVIRNMANMEKSLGRFDEALALIRKASELDPVRPPIFTSLGLFSMYADRLDAAATAYQRAIALNPRHPAAHTFLGLVYLLQGKPDEAVTEIRQESDEGWRLYGLAQAYYGASRRAEADSALNALIQDYGSESAYQVAEAYAYRGDADRAFDWLERAYAARDGGLSELKGDPFMKKIESDPRYAELLRKMNLPK